jgi:hypothetical protein
MSQASTHVADTADTPGALMHLVAAGLTGNGFRVGLPQPGAGRRLSIACPAARCILTVEDWGAVVAEWSPAASSVIDPLELADLASALLTGRAGLARWQDDCRDRTDLSLKAKVGRELRARGLLAGLEVWPDELSFEAHTAVVATAPGTDAEVRVTDDGWLSWERDYAAEEAACRWQPECATWIADPGKVAADVIAAVTLALSQNLPGQAGQR